MNRIRSWWFRVFRHHQTTIKTLFLEIFQIFDIICGIYFGNTIPKCSPNTGHIFIHIFPEAVFDLCSLGSNQIKMTSIKINRFNHVEAIFSLKYAKNIIRYHLIKLMTGKLSSPFFDRDPKSHTFSHTNAKRTYSPKP